MSVSAPEDFATVALSFECAFFNAMTKNKRPKLTKGDKKLVKAFLEGRKSALLELMEFLKNKE